ncbi:GNAT family N-acetyltransferase [Lentilitoribacter sp. Alg239-R112]|uniref:GNAT family N-acetyltransferase n=1 Tax=Lentilitoribacter sp. Alg239-R112 TaxID=2305987 RepID=UPI0013A6B04B|nr:GNAT family N-acetyltransferase [Lentilitoribacter sp. Alg239-R112]
MIDEQDMMSKAASSLQTTATHNELAIEPDRMIRIGTEGRELAIYPARSGYELERELEFISNRALEPNIFFTSGFLAPAMPRLDNRTVQLCVMRDVNAQRSRIRLLLPFSVEKPNLGIGVPIMRIWSNEYGPLGTPLIDSENALQSLDDFMEGVSRDEMKLPNVLVFPDIRLDSSFARMMSGIALSKNLPLAITNKFERPMLESEIDSPDYISSAISKHHLRDLERQRRRLAEMGELEFVIARQPGDIRVALDEFLHLENKGWKGQKKTSLVADRHRAAFAREAVQNLAELDRVRIHSLQLDGKVIASLIVFVMGGESYTWKTTFDEDYSTLSVGKLLMQQTTEWQLDDFNTIRTDSCAVPDHPIMSRFWKERCEMGTIIVGTSPNSDKDVRQVTKQLDIYRSSKNLAKNIRDKVRAIAKNKF